MGAVREGNRASRHALPPLRLKSVTFRRCRPHFLRLPLAAQVLPPALPLGLRTRWARRPRCSLAKKIEHAPPPPSPRRQLRVPEPTREESVALDCSPPWFGWRQSH